MKHAVDPSVDYDQQNSSIILLVIKLVDISILANIYIYIYIYISADTDNIPILSCIPNDLYITQAYESQKSAVLQWVSGAVIESNTAHVAE